MSLPSNWSLFALAEVCEINPRVSHNLEDDDLISFLPMKAVDDIYGVISGFEEKPLVEVKKGYTAFQEGDVLFAKITPCMENGKSAVARNLTNKKGYGSTEFHVLRPRDGLNADYMHHFIRQTSFRFWARNSFVGSAGQQRVPTQFFRYAKIPVPPLKEQQEIVNILQQAEDLRRMRQDSLEKAEKLASALFLEIFGHPITNPKGWNETQRLGQKADIVSGFTKGRKTQGKSVREVPYLTVANVQDNYLKLENVKSIGATDDEIKKYQLQFNDLLLTEGGDPDKLGRGALWQEELSECIHQNHVFRVRLTTTDLHPVFLNYLVGSIRGKSYFLRTAKQTTGIASINISQLKAFPLLSPPFDLQERFVEGVAEIDRQIELLKSQLAKLEVFLQTLQYQAFSGKITKEWRANQSNTVPVNSSVKIQASAAASITGTVQAEAKLNLPHEYNRREVTGQLSLFQKIVWKYFSTSDSYAPDDLSALIAELPESITNNDQARLRKTLATLTALGLIKKVSVPDKGRFITDPPHKLRTAQESSLV